MKLRGRVLSIAGSDCSGGAGIQADINTIAALGAYAATAITAITVQDTMRVHEVHKVDPAVVAAQIACVLADPGVDAIKTGMLVDAATIAAVKAALARHAGALPLVIDPVMVSTSGTALLDEHAIAALRDFCRGAAIITPNRAEAERLLNRRIENPTGLRDAAVALHALGPGAVLITGGDGQDDTVIDVLKTQGGFFEFAHKRKNTRHTHGTGCTLAAAIATGLAQGMDVYEAVDRAIGFVQAAIASAPGFGAGHGPINHAACSAAAPPDA